MSPEDFDALLERLSLRNVVPLCLNTPGRSPLNTEMEHEPLEE